MEDFVGLAILVLAALVISIVALAKSAGLKASIDELKRRVMEVERPGEAAAPKLAPVKAETPPPLPAFVTAPQPSKPKNRTCIISPATSAADSVQLGIDTRRQTVRLDRRTRPFSGRRFLRQIRVRK